MAEFDLLRHRHLYTYLRFECPMIMVTAGVTFFFRENLCRRRPPGRSMFCQPGLLIHRAVLTVLAAHTGNQHSVAWTRYSQNLFSSILLWQR